VPPIRTVRSALPSFLGGLSLGLLAWRWLRRGDVAEIDRQRLEGEAESERLRLRLTSIQGPADTTEPGTVEPGIIQPGIIDLTAEEAPDLLIPEPRHRTTGSAGAEIPPATALGTPGSAHRDDLKQIRGIGPVMERTLNELGIQSYEQIANLSKDEVDQLGAAIATFPGRIERDDWVGGARRLLDRQKATNGT
jgi:predicted flap endonuclease-1-like 5' DNA nuclease